MQHHLADGYAAAEAATLASRTAGHNDESIATPAAKDELAAALASFDDADAHAVFDNLLARLSIDTLLRDVIVPYLHELGERWEREEVSIAQEHFASTVLRGRLLGLARGWGRASGRSLSSPVPPGSNTTSASSPSDWRCAHAAGVSSTSAPTRQSQASPTPHDHAHPQQWS